jgi:redox-sensitive bicupin YhaK (pirin superfamily)
VHFLQIWILPEAQSLAPGYEQKNFSVEDKTNRLRLVASRDGADGSITVHQDMRIYASVLTAGTSLTHSLAEGRHAWLQVVSGDVTVAGEALTAGDGIAVSDIDGIDVTAGTESELLLFDMPI